MAKISHFPILLGLFLLLFFSCSKDAEITTQKSVSPTQIAIDETDFEYDPTFNQNDPSRGLCGTLGVSIEYPGKQEFEFDVIFGAWGKFHFFNTPSGTIKTKYPLPIMVQEQLITLGNKPIAKQNPKCPWLGRPTGEIIIKVMMVRKNASGKWEQVPGSDYITYTLGDTKPSQTLMSGGRVFCMDKPIGKWKMCKIYK